MASESEGKGGQAANVGSGAAGGTQPASGPARRADAKAAPTPSAEPTALDRAWKTLKARPDPLSGVALTLPVFLVYHLGIVLLPERTGVDFLSRLVFLLLDASIPAYVITTFALALAVASVVWVQQKRGAVPVWAVGRVLAEGFAIALLLVVTLGWATYRFLRGTPLADASELSVVAKVLIACGTGFHGELIFHALFVTGGSALLMKALQLPKHSALIVTLLFSSLAFAIASYVGPHADVFAFDTFLYRSLLGLVLAFVYLLRGFAVAVYTHVFYAGLVFFVYA